MNEMYAAPAIEQGTSRYGRWLRERRLRITLAIAAVEALLYLFHVLNWWAAVGLAVVAVAFWWYVGRANRSDALRQISWVFAASQLLVLCVPIALALVTAVAIAVIAILAIVALFVLFKERP